MAKAKKKKSGSSKKTGPVVPKRSNGYIKRRDARVNAYREAEKDTTIQFMTDMLMLTLNDSDVMKKDVFGKKRLARVIQAWGEKWDKYHGALEAGDERDYYQEKLDQALKKIMGDDLVEFPDRYPWLFE
ncbi:MAG: hypothetical protein IKJ99_03700 [Oscillospiraceae bacterium]|nr:hypothetical protein [Oscillospiraceae bacterium]